MTHMEGEQVMFRDITLVYKTKKKNKDALAEERKKWQLSAHNGLCMVVMGSLCSTSTFNTSVLDCFYIPLFSASEQTPCTLVACNSE